jgi:hypothetical protein
MNKWMQWPAKDNAVLDSNLTSIESFIGKENSPDDFYCVNDIWINPLSSIAGGGLRIWNRAVKFAITEEQLLAEEPMIRARCEELEKDGFILGSMEESDIKLMLESNKVYYPEDYGKHIIKRSVCFRKDGKMVAWAGTHSDCKYICYEMDTSSFSYEPMTDQFFLTTRDELGF